MLIDEKVRDALNLFAKFVITESRNNLEAEKKSSGELYKTMSHYIEKFGDGFKLVFEMEDYGKFVDKGVKGKDPSKVSSNAKITGQQAPNSPYRFGSGKFPNTWDKFVKRMSMFAKQRSIRFRETKIVDGKKVSTGRFAKGGFDAVGYVIAKNIYNRGIRPSMFFTKPFESAFKTLPQKLLEAYSVGIEKQIQVNLTKK